MDQNRTGDTKTSFISMVRYLARNLSFFATMANEREEFMQETQHTQQTATRKAQNQDKKNNMNINGYKIQKTHRNKRTFIKGKMGVHTDKRPMCNKYTRWYAVANQSTFTLYYRTARALTKSERAHRKLFDSQIALCFTDTGLVCSILTEDITLKSVCPKQ